MSTQGKCFVSVVVPVYNVEKFLPQCLDSLLAQTLADMEILLVDDGSTDSSGAICDDYAALHRQMRVIHKENGGLMSAWKAGFLQTSGEYVGFVDSDDWVEPEMFRTLYEKAAETGADMVACGLVREYGERSTLEEIHPQTGFYHLERIQNEIFPKLINFGPMMERYISPNRVTKLIRRSLLMNNLELCDEKISVGEDLVATFSCVLDAQSIFVLQNFHPYHYRIHNASIMGSYNPRFFEQAVLLNRQLRKIAAEKNVFDFSVQLNSDFVGLIFLGIEHNLMGAPEKGGEIRKTMKTVFSDRYFQQAIKKQIVTKSSSKCRIYEIFLRLHWYTGLYLFIRYVVCVKRKHLGY